MTTIKVLSKNGETTLVLESVEESQKVIEEEWAKGNMVYDEDEKRIVEKATFGKITANSRLISVPFVAGG